MSIIVFHLVIRYTIGPNFIYQIFCYIVFVPISSIYSYNHSNINNNDDPYLYIIFGNIILIGLVGIFYFKIESYPLSMYPMYGILREIDMFDSKDKAFDSLKEYVFKQKKESKFWPGFDALYHFPKQLWEWISITIIIYSKSDRNIVIYKSPNVRNTRLRSTYNGCTFGVRGIEKRRCNDALYSMYLNNELKNRKQTLYSGIIGESITIKNKRLERYIQGLMQFFDAKYMDELQKNIYSTDKIELKGAPYDIVFEI